MSENELPEDARRRHLTPYTDKRKIPTISKYRAEQEARQEKARAFEGRNSVTDGEGTYESPQDLRAPADQRFSEEDGLPPEEQETEREHDDVPRDTSEATTGATDPRQRMKERKKGRDEAAEREVTDPVTHLPVRIRDYTNDALEQVPENREHYGSTTRTATGLSNKSKSSKELEQELRHLRKEREAMQGLFPPPDFDAVKEELAGIHKLGMTVGLAGTIVVVLLVLAVDRLLRSAVLQRHTPDIQSGWLVTLSKWLLLAGLAGGAVALLVLAVRDWVTKRVDALWEDELWDAKRHEQMKGTRSRDAESVAWLNSLMAAVWPLVNPDLFTSLADTLEDGEWHFVSRSHEVSYIYVLTRGA